MLIVATARPELLERRPEWADKRLRDDARAAAALGRRDARARRRARRRGRDARRHDRRDRRQRVGQPAVLRRVRADARRPRAARARRRVARGSTAARGAGPPGVAARASSPRASTRSAPTTSGSCTPARSSAGSCGRARWRPSPAVRDDGSPDACATSRSASSCRARADSSVEGEPEYRFRHVLIRDVAYSEIPRLRRGEIHRKTAEWLASLSPDRAGRSGRDARPPLRVRLRADARRRRRRDGARRSGPPRAARRRRPGPQPQRLPGRGTLLPRRARPVAGRRPRASVAALPPRASRPTTRRRRAPRSSRRPATRCSPRAIAGRRRRPRRSSPTSPTTRGARPGLRAPRSGRRAGRRPRARRRSRPRCSSISRTTCPWPRPRAHDRRGDARRSRSRGRSACARSRPARCATIGISRGLSGDLGGRDDLERSIAIAEEIGSHLSAQCCGVLADLECNVGDLETCFALQKRARGRTPSASATPASCAGSPASAWASATGPATGTRRCARRTRFIAEAEAGTPNFMEGYCRADARADPPRARRPRGGARRRGACGRASRARPRTPRCSIRPSPSARAQRSSSGRWTGA